jgi:CheY-like chemotaxis protein
VAEGAENGLQSLQKLETQAYDLILTDVRMPELDGVGLYREIARRFPGVTRRMIFFTGDTLIREATAFLEETGLPSVRKPFKGPEIHAVTQQVLRIR